MSTDEIIALGYGVSWLVSWPFFTRYAWDTGHGLSNDRDRMDTVLVGGLVSMFWLPFLAGLGFLRVLRWWLP